MDIIKRYPSNRLDNWIIIGTKSGRVITYYVNALYEDAVEYSKVLNLDDIRIEPIFIKSVNKVSLAQLKRIAK